MPKPSSAKRSRRPSSRFPLTSTTLSARPPRTPARSPVSTCAASSMSRPPRRSLTVSTRRRTKRSPCIDLGGGTFDISCSKSATASSKCSPPMATPTSAVTTGTTRSSPGSTNSRRTTASTSARARWRASAHQGRSREGQDRPQLQPELRHQPALHHGRRFGPKHINEELTRAKMEQLCDSLFERTIKPSRSCLKDAKLTSSKIDELVLVGGMTRMPKVVETANKLGRQRPASGRESGRSRRHRRGHPGRCAQGRGEGRAPARRDPAHAPSRPPAVSPRR
jgi:hypothetical protein